MEQKQLTTEELSQIKELRDKGSDLVIKLGEISYQMLELESSKDDLKNQFIILKIEELALINQIKTKYGEIDFSLETGEIK